MSKGDIPNYRDDMEGMRFPIGLVIIFLVLVGVTVMFLACSAAFVYTRYTSDLPGIEMPSMFFLTSAVLIGSSFVLNYSRKYFDRNSLPKLKYALTGTLILTVLFLAGQIIGYYQMIRAEQFINSNHSLSYLYLVSGLHFIHVIFGIPFLGWLLIQVFWQSRKEDFNQLMFFSNEKFRSQLRYVTIYWHFVDALWIYLLLLFLINNWTQ